MTAVKPDGSWPVAKTKRGMTQDWITPRWILDALGPFDLDPCASTSQPWPTAARMISLPQDGLAVRREGRVWLNHPYGANDTKAWLRKMAEHGRGVSLMFARTETQAFHDHVFGAASGIYFFKHRLYFCRPDGSVPPHNGGAPSCLVSYSEDDAEDLARFEAKVGVGKFVRLAPR
jgi:hypothetical protein